MPRVDPDGVFRSSYAPYADTLRLRSSENPLGTGSNAQNVDREARAIYVPPPGTVFLGIDGAQVEDCIVKVRTKAPRLIEIARLPPWERPDPHSKAGSIAFKVPESQVTREQRYAGKRARHGGNYGLMGQNLADQLLKEGIVYTAEECQRMMDDIIDKDTPEVRDYHRMVRRLLMRDRALTNSWGWTISYEYERLGDDLYRRGYALLPQSDQGIWMSLWGLVPLDGWIEARKEVKHISFMAQGRPHPAIHQDGHDSLLTSVHPFDAWSVAKVMQASLERPRMYDGIELTLYLEYSLGSSWDAQDMQEFKQLPSKEEFTAAAFEVLESIRRIPF